MTASATASKAAAIVRKHVGEDGQQAKAAAALRTNLRDIYLSNGEAPNSTEDLQVKQFLDYISLVIAPSLNDRKAVASIMLELDSYLRTRSYFVGRQFSTADAATFAAVRSIMATMTLQEMDQYVNLVRWFNHIQETQPKLAGGKRVNFPLIYNKIEKPVYVE